MSVKIYTKTGDQGKTSLIGGTKVFKSHLRIEAYGTVDELNSFIGSLNDHLNDTGTKKILAEIQDRLFTIGSSLACDPEKEPKMKIPDLREDDIVLLEKEIDRMNESLPPMKSFILPGGHPAVSAAHIARCVCRRAMSSSWVTSTTVFPPSCILLNMSMISTDVLLSRLPVGSSARMIEGLLTSALAIATRWHCPPESSFGL